MFTPQKLFILSSAIAVLWLCACARVLAQGEQPNLTWELGPTGSKASLRGISATDAGKTVWASGSSATVLRSIDAGSSWEACGPEGFGELEFRCIHAWDKNDAIIASAGTPAVILKTKDGGNTWKEVYRHASSEAFLDGLKFFPESVKDRNQQRGIAFGDPIGLVDSELSIMILETRDGGATWTETRGPKAAQGEAGFAASNSSMWLGNNGQVWIGTGAAKLPHSRIHYRPSWEAAWKTFETPICSDAAHGIFSVFAGIQEGRETFVAVGGDYRPDAQSQLTAIYSTDGGRTWAPAPMPPASYRSAVVFNSANPQTTQNDSTWPTTAGWIAVGPAGSDWSADGRSWQPFSSEGFHALAVSGKLVFASGSNGRIAILRSKN